MGRIPRRVGCVSCPSSCIAPGGSVISVIVEFEELVTMCIIGVLLSDIGLVLVLFVILISLEVSGTARTVVGNAEIRGHGGGVCWDRALA
ncbi:MAG: hypothetical protein OK454_06615 [Thaumarchaeota archaeon]|nr:hypothetical protein [Nitrososphaerota archaeon]